jgi:succinate dehydrogenase / fumarate reductase, cytochrome b subunit
MDQALVKDTRPVNLDLTTFKFPLPAITSILHRISGVFIFLGVALLLFLLQLSLESQAGFNQVLDILANPLMKLLTWAVVAGLLYHLIAGCKHLLMDLGIGETKEGARTAAIITLILAAIAIVVSGVWIW